MHSTKLERILRDVRLEVDRSKEGTSEEELRRRIKDAPAVRSLEQALTPGFGLIAEIKQKSPSGGSMLPKNVAEAPEAYEQSDLVKAISILTNETHFGMSIRSLEKIRSEVSKPILRKDFIIDRYQIFEARAYGADAILLMGNVLSPEQLLEFSNLAFDLGLEVLFESHTKAQLDHIPHQKARIYGINCRMMDSGTKSIFGLSPYSISRLFSMPLFGQSRYSIRRALIKVGFVNPDVSTDFKRFERLFSHLPASAIKIAESGISSSTITEVRNMGFNAALIGNSLLLAPEGISSALESFDRALAQCENCIPQELPLATPAKDVAYSHR